MKKWLIGLLFVVFLGACVPAQTSSPDVEPALTAVLDGKTTATPEPALKPVATSEPTATAVVEQTPTETAVAKQVPADNAESDRPGKTDVVPAGAVLVFHRTGGFAGVDQRWVVYADGRIENPDGVQIQADASQVQAVLETAENANFVSLNESYIPLGACCDHFSYSVTIQIDGETKTVSTIDNAPKQPEGLTAVMTAINILLFDSK
ncbi:MAG: hypothetical protein GY803_10040 [Chloroflexi bacterium]|nr:hypothetical protein [Chloroflexota bacterium]